MAEILGVVVSLLGPAIKLVKCIVVPVKRQFNYLCYLGSNIDDLREEVRKLEDARGELQMRVTTAENNAEDIVPPVKTWLEKEDENIPIDMNGIESEFKNIKSGCLAVKSRYSLSRKVKKMTEAVKQHKDGCKFDVISQPAQPQSVVPPPLGHAYEFQSRNNIEEGIMRALRGEEVKTMGICGMGGVGKTTMAIKIMNRVKEDNLFDETVMVAVSQNVDKSSIQHELAEKLGLEKFQETKLESRAHKLRTRLTGGKNILIVVDDVWQYLNLKELGIPCETGSKGGCKILLTSRNRDVLINMEAQPIHEVQTLSESEAWSLFREKVGTCVDDKKLFSIAQKIVRKCKYLPIALVNVAMGLKDKKDKSIWKDALEQLKSSNPEDLPHILKEVYNPIKLSYDFLESQNAKSIFLLCCLFPEDYDIPLEDLTIYAMGLRIFERIGSLEQARNRTCTLVDTLKSHFLLLEDEDHNKDCVKMHDVVRDVAIYIASKEKRIECNDCIWLSSPLGDQRINELSNGTFPNLSLLLIDGAADEKLQINDNFFEKMKKLNVLYIKYVSVRSVPQTTQLLENLRTLVLRSCKSLETISVVGKLVNLEILICRNCYSIRELPIEIGRLSRLKLLEFSYSRKLRTIVPGVISSLVGLEELKILKSFDKWEAKVEGKERNNAALSELQSLYSLANLEIEVEDFTLAAEQMCISPKIEKFVIRIGCWPYIPRRFENAMTLDLPREITLANWIHECVRSVECMCLRGDGSSNLDLGQAQNMRWLFLKQCSTLKKLVNVTASSIDVFRHLEHLQLEELANLEVICGIDTNPEGSFVDALKNLRVLELKFLPALKLFWKDPYQINGVVSHFSNLSSVTVKRCDRLRNLFSLSPSTENDCLLPQLESLGIEDCKMMEQVFLWDDEKNKKDIGQESNHIKIIFPKLRRLTLSNLPNLTTFCKGIESIEFPLLSAMKVKCCPKLKSLASSSTGNDNQNMISRDISHDDDNHSLHLICKPGKVAFGSLKELDIRGDNSLRLLCDQVSTDFFRGLNELSIDKCGSINSLFSSSIAQNLVNLERLQIEKCEKMVKVIEDELEKLDECCGENTISLFPNLKWLYLESLPELKTFREYSLELPSLEKVSIRYCPKIERFSLGSLTTPNLNLEGITIEPKDDLDSEITKDLVRDFNDTKDFNALLQQVFFILKEAQEKKKKKREEEGHQDEEEAEKGEEGEEKEEGEREVDQNQGKGEIEEEEN